MENAKMNVMGFWGRLIRPLMNERGEVGAGEPPAIPLDENGFIPGTTYKSLDDLVKGHGELKTRFDAQGNEIGQLRGQAQTLAETLKETLTKSKQAEPAAKGTDFDTEINAAQNALKKLDPMSDNFTEQQAELVGKITDLKSEKVKTSVLSEAGKLFQQELKDRDVKTAEKTFLEQNPTFNTPEMQGKIKDFLAKDKTGMHDNMSAYFALQAQEVAVDRERLAKQNEEMQKALDLQKGKDSTGKVIVKGQSPGQPTNQPKLEGKDRDAAMLAALDKVREAS
jgi:hypothetical protein